MSIPFLNKAYFSTNVGIGTNSPTRTLDVTGEVNISGGDGLFMDGDAVMSYGGGPLIVGDWDGGGFDTKIIGGSGSTEINLSSSGVAVNANTTFGTTTRNVDTIVKALTNDSHVAGFEAMGASQGTGYFYAGQASNYGGGMFYNGDGSPTFASGESVDTIGFYRRSNNSNFAVFDYSVNSSTVNFKGDIQVIGGDITLGGTGRIQGVDTVSADTDAANKLYVDTVSGGGLPGKVTSRSASYTSLTGSASDWFPLFTITDQMGPVNCKIFTYAHEALDFTVAEGYGPNGTGTITLLNSVQSSNGGFATTHAIRINEDGGVEVQLYWSTGPTVNIGVNITGYNVPVLPVSLVTTTSTATIADSVNVNDDGKLRSKSVLQAGGDSDSATTTNIIRFDIDGDSYINSGSVGIGTASPTDNLDLRGTFSQRPATDATAVWQLKSADGGLKVRLDLDGGDSALLMRNEADVYTTRIDSNGNSYFTGGNVGIGVTNPTRRLNVKATGPAIIAVFETTSTAAGRISLSDANTTAETSVGIGAIGNDLGLYANGAQRVYIEGGGDVGIGTSTPSTTLDVNGVITATGGNSTQWNSNVADGPYLPLTASSTKPLTGELYLNEGSRVASGKNITFYDHDGIYPSATGGFKWDLNNDQALIYAQQPAADYIDFVFKIKDNVASTDRFVYWIDSWSGEADDAFPLYMDGNKTVFNYPGFYGTGNSKNIDFYLVGNNQSSISNAYFFGDAGNGRIGIGTTSPTYKLDVVGTLRASSVIHSNTSFEANNTNQRVKYSVYAGTTYGTGFGSSYTFGGLNDFAMTFQMSNTSTRGWWWGDTGHSNAQGAMSLTTKGLLNVAGLTRIGYGESSTTAPATYGLDVSGSGRFTDEVTATKFIGQQIWVSSNFRHRNTHLIGYYYFPFNSATVSNATSYANVYIPANAGTVDKIILKNVNVASAATSTLLRVLINGTVTFTSAALTSTATLYASVTTAVTSSTFVAGDRIQIQLDANAEWNDVSAIIECSIT